VIRKTCININIFPVFFFIFILTSIGSALAQEESKSSKRMAEMMAKMIDENWETAPEKGTANIKILMTKDGKPYAGKISIHTDFSFRAIGRWHHSQGFNPNSNGRWIYEGIEPGTYKLEIEGLHEFKGWNWTKDSVEVKSGETPLFEISLD
jgi:hypothetical protein